MKQANKITPFTIDISNDILLDLKRRLAHARWPDQVSNIGWQQGTELDYLKQLMSVWEKDFNWRAVEKKLNHFQHYLTEIDGLSLHFIHQKAASGEGIPLILTHGWPSTFIEMLPLVPLLTDPLSHGIKGPSFDLIIPSLPGYIFSERPDHSNVNYHFTAKLWSKLMKRLGYSKFGAGGTDFGSGVSTLMALEEPESILGLHLTNFDLAPMIDESSPQLSSKEQTYIADREKWDQQERGYSALQSTKPQTLAYGLNDSPIGLAAWVVEKWRSWSDSNGDLEGALSKEELLSTLTLFWATQTITSSMRDYYDNRHSPINLSAKDYITVPTGIALFDHEFISEGSPPREWVKRLYNVTHWSPMPRGGHFAAMEQPHLLAQDIASFFKTLV